MILSLDDDANYRQPLAQWPMPLNTPFVASRELDWLTRDLDRYVRGRVRGRSYLIAGHRGAGKTALTVRAVEQLASEILRRSVMTGPSQLPDGPFQRPLLVKLHGPSMLEAQQVPVATAACPPVAGNGRGDEDGDAIGDGGKASEPRPANIVSGVHSALIQITIGLYRALASEAAVGFRANALYIAERSAGDQAERAAQVALDLDSAAEPARLKRHWSALGRLRAGVFWPATADPTLQDHLMRDQGLLEISALATAGQAFQVCTGRISYQTKVKDSAVRTLTSELKGSSDLKETLARLGTLGIGALTGVSIFATSNASPTAAIAGGLAVWLLGSLGLSWSRKSTHSADRSVDYSFIRDFTIETLGRDLPVVISRVREAGLAPVFVIDELDKVADAPKALAEIVSQLKYLIADFGFFCFLVNRDCYERIEASIGGRAYPSEHTLFSERLLVRPDPEYLLPYLMSLIKIEPDDPLAGLARATFALNAMHETRLNLTELTRLLARVQRGVDREIGTSADLAAPRRLVLATVQIAIDQVLRTPELADRMDSRPSFAQLVIDTLYYPSRCWEEGELDIDPSVDALKEYLEKRLNSDRGLDPEDSGDALAHLTVANAELEILQRHLMQLLEYLADLSILRDHLGDRNAGAPPGDVATGDIGLASLLPPDVPAICITGQNGCFRFEYTRDGDKVTAIPGRMSIDQRRQVRSHLDYVTAFEALLKDLGLNLDELGRTALLPLVSRRSLALAREELGVAMRQARYNADVEQRVSTIEYFIARVTANSAKLGALFIIMASLKRDVGGDRVSLPRVSRLLRYDVMPDKWLADLPQIGLHPLPLDVAGLKKWHSDYGAWLAPAPGMGELSSILEWHALADPMKRYFRRPSRPSFPRVDYAALLLAVRRRFPAAALTVNLANMTVGDWSALALSAMPRAGIEPSAPYWMLIAALRGLGFGKDALLDLADPDFLPDLYNTGWQLEAPGMTAEASLGLARELADGAAIRKPGLIVVENDIEVYGQSPPNKRRPVLIVDSGVYRDYLPVLSWLEALGIFSGRTVPPTDEGVIE